MTTNLSPDILLSQSKSVGVVGSRPLQKRKITKILAKSLLSIVTTLSVLNHTPVGQELGWFIYRVAIQGNKAPEIPHWQPSVSYVNNGSIASSYNEANPGILDPFTAAFGSTEDGFEPGFYSIEDSEKLVDFLKQHLTPDQAMITISAIHTAGGVSILGRTDPELAKSEAQRQKKAQDWLYGLWEIVDDPQKVQEFFNQHPIKDASTEINESKLNDVNPQSPEEGWDIVLLQSLQPFTVLMNTEDSYYTKRLPQTNQTGDQALAEAIQNSGLAAVRLPQSFMKRNKAKKRLAQLINQANTDLENVTGWKGQVLGLNSRVVWEFDARGFTASTTTENGYIYIKSWWDKMAHEWYHALDRAQGQTVNVLGVMNKSNILLSQANSPRFGEVTSLGDEFGLAQAQHALWQGMHQPILSQHERQVIANEYLTYSLFIQEEQQKWTTAVRPGFLDIQQEAGNTVVEKGSPWLYWTNKARQKEKKNSVNEFFFGNSQERYVGNMSEILARGFSYFAIYSLDITQNPVLRNKDNDEHSQKMAVFRPTKVEALAQRKTWQAHFSDTAAWWINDSHQRRIKVEPLLSSTIKTAQNKQGSLRGTRPTR